MTCTEFQSNLVNIYIIIVRGDACMDSTELLIFVTG